LWVFALLAAGCSTQEAVCDRLTTALQDCGFAITELDCSRVAEGDLEQLAQQYGDRQCAGFSKGDGAVDPRLCTLADWKCPDSPIAPPQQVAPRYPLVLVSGIDGSPLFDWNPRIQAALSAWGVETHHVQVLPWATTPERADDLWQSLRSLRAHLGQGARLNLVCYAVGGLDCRYLVSPGGLFADDPAQLAEAQQAIASITTIATPHRGTQVADAALGELQSGTADDLLQALAGDGVSVKVSDDAQVERVLEGLGPDALDQFDATVTDAPGVLYFSWAGVSVLAGRATAQNDTAIAQHCVDSAGQPAFYAHPGTRDSLAAPLVATAPFSYLSHGAEGETVHAPSDGMVSVESAKWGYFLGCLPADHYDVVGQLGHTTRDPVTGFDPVVLYETQASLLAAEGL
jgi:triacylglycerol lipase